jgi:arylsulfatase A-like enzyme
MRTALSLFAVALSGFALAAPPNVVIVMTDDQGLGDFSYTGNPILKTPHFDAFAKQSVRLTDFHVSPMCSPTRGQLLTGLAALRNGATSVTAGRTFLRPGLPTLPEVFGKAGYKTGLFGKWHLGDSYPHRPHDKGFQESVYHLGWGQQQSTAEADWPLIDGRYFHNGEQKMYKGHCTDFWFDSAMAWMKDRKAKGEPFVCYIPTNAPHAPFVDLDEYIQPYRGGKGPAAFFGMIAHLDKRFGDLEKFLTDEKLRDDTIVIFMTDNGGTAGVQTHNAGLRAGKTTYYDGGHRVPCWVRWPNGKLGEPRDIDTPTQNTDLFPTLCDLCGVPLPKGDKADDPYRGVSLAGLLKGEKLADRKFVVQYGQVPKKDEACVVWGRWRLVHGKELYDVAADREQKTNVADKNPDVLAAMTEYYSGWWKGVEPLLGEFVPQSIGAKQEPTVLLTSGEWENIYSDNIGYVREAVGGPTGGKWHVKVEREGEYTFTLRRWPEKFGLALGDSYDGPNYANKKSAVFPKIAQAKVEVGGVTGEAKADAKEKAASVTVKLPAGVTTLKAWFADAAGQGQCGAFYVTVTGPK